MSADLVEKFRSHIEQRVFLTLKSGDRKECTLHHVLQSTLHQQAWVAIISEGVVVQTLRISEFLNIEPVQKSVVYPFRI